MLLFDLGVKCCAVGTRCQGACFCSGACLHSDPTVIFRRCWCLDALYGEKGGGSGAVGIGFAPSGCSLWLEA